MDNEKRTKIMKRFKDQVTYSLNRMDIDLEMAKSDARVASATPEEISEFEKEAREYIKSRVSNY